MSDSQIFMCALIVILVGGLVGYALPMGYDRWVDMENSRISQ